MDLSRFDRQIAFTAVEIACLMCGIDPAENYPKDVIQNDLRLLETAFLNGFKFCKGDTSFVDAKGAVERCLFPVKIEKIFLMEMDKPARKEASFDEVTRNIDYTPDESDIRHMEFNDDALVVYLDCFSSGNLDFTEIGFSRSEIFIWLHQNGYVSKYLFEPIGVTQSANIPSDVVPSFTLPKKDAEHIASAEREKFIAERNEQLRLFGTKGAEARKSNYGPLEKFISERAPKMKGSDMDIARKLWGQLPLHLGNVSKNPEKFIYNFIRKNKKSR